MDKETIDQVTRREFFKTVTTLGVGLAAGLRFLGGGETAEAAVDLADDPVIRALQEPIPDELIEYPPGAARIVPNGEWLSTRHWPNGGRRKLGAHVGLDFVAPYGDIVIASAGGMAKFFETRWGKKINIRHTQKFRKGGIPYDVFTRYAHLSKSYIADDKKWHLVSRGQTIGKVGFSGTDITHLHWSASVKDWRTGKWHFVNPLWLLSGGHGKFECYKAGKMYSLWQIALTHPLKCTQ